MHEVDLQSDEHNSPQNKTSSRRGGAETKLLRSIGPSSQKYAPKFSELEDNIVNTHKTHIIIRRSKFSEPTAKVLREVGDDVQNFANQRGRVILQVAGAEAVAKYFGRWHNRNQVMESKLKLKLRVIKS